MADVVATIVDSPLMYIIVGIVLTFFTEWRIRSMIKKIRQNVNMEKLFKALGEGMGQSIQEALDNADRNGSFEKILRKIIKLIVEAYLNKS